MVLRHDCVKQGARHHRTMRHEIIRDQLLIPDAGKFLLSLHATSTIYYLSLFVYLSVGQYYTRSPRKAGGKLWPSKTHFLPSSKTPLVMMPVSSSVAIVSAVRPLGFLREHMTMNSWRGEPIFGGITSFAAAK